VWQATLVQNKLREHKVEAELIYIKSEGDIDTSTPLYELGVQGIFTKALDIALLDGRIDLAVHSMKDVPTQPAKNLSQAAVLERGNYKDLLVYKDVDEINSKGYIAHIATSSVRRAAQWLHKYPGHRIENIRGNVNTRLKKFRESDWDGVIFAAAGLERIQLRPENSIELEWMLPAPSQGAIVILCRDSDKETYAICEELNHTESAICTQIEKDFLKALKGGCSTPVSALAIIRNNKILFRGNICSTDGELLIEVEKEEKITDAKITGEEAARDLMKDQRVNKILEDIRNAR
jgi:hydroxymethylbilane synthase